MTGTHWWSMPKPVSTNIAQTAWHSNWCFQLTANMIFGMIWLARFECFEKGKQWLEDLIDYVWMIIAYSNVTHRWLHDSIGFDDARQLSGNYSIMNCTEDWMSTASESTASNEMPLNVHQSVPSQTCWMRDSVYSFRHVFWMTIELVDENQMNLQRLRRCFENEIKSNSSSSVLSFDFRWFFSSKIYNFQKIKSFQSNLISFRIDDAKVLKKLN